MSGSYLDGWTYTSPVSGPRTAQLTILIDDPQVQSVFTPGRTFTHLGQMLRVEWLRTSYDVHHHEWRLEVECVVVP